MARPLRSDYPGAWHHIWQRGARHAPIFHKDLHCHLFFDVVAETVLRRGIEVHAYALMPSHYHLLLRSVAGNVSGAMQDINGNYSRRLNRIYSWDGPLFRGRYKSQLVENEDYLKHLLAYLHLNPVRAHLVSEPQEECWTSHQAYIGLTERPPWLSCAFMEELFGGRQPIHEHVMERQRGSSQWPAEMDLETGWFRIQESRPIGVSAGGPLGNPPCRYEADTVLELVCRIAGRTEADLRRVERGPRANPARRFAILALDRWTLLTQRLVGERLDMSTSQVSKVLERYRSTETAPICGWMELLAVELGGEAGW